MPQIIPIKDLKNTAEIFELCHNTDEPVYITKNGYVDMIIMSIENFEGLIRRLKRYQEIEISERQIHEGKVKNAKSALASMGEKYGIQFSDHGAGR